LSSLCAAHEFFARHAQNTISLRHVFARNERGRGRPVADFEVAGRGYDKVNKTRNRAHRRLVVQAHAPRTDMADSSSLRLQKVLASASGSLVSWDGFVTKTVADQFADGTDFKKSGAARTA
jgi:hypothetical protein